MQVFMSEDDRGLARLLNKSLDEMPRSASLRIAAHGALNSGSEILAPVEPR